jgi:dipeptidyl aminopeptidase/acylaminoacyl peptidase
VQRDASGSGAEEILYESTAPLSVEDWSRDGRTLLFESRGDVFLLPLDGDRRATPLLSTPFEESDPQLSPDGHWVVYRSNETGRTEVYVASIPPGQKQQISNDGGRMPRWRADGKELFYIDANNRLMAARLDAASPTVEAGAPRPLFRSGLRFPCSEYVPSRDGNRFLMSRPVGDLPASPLTVVLDWSAGLRR